jgi:ABC-type multidrug transport system fused ATPase/permease subunit
VILGRRKEQAGKRPRGTLLRLVAALVGPERPRLVLATVFAVLSAGLLLVGPVVLGNATNVVFDGFIGGRLHHGQTKAEVMTGLRAHGDSTLARMLSVMNVTPGAGINFTWLGKLLGMAALVYLASAVFSWAQGYIMAGVSQRTMYRLREAVEAKLGRMPLSFFDRNPHGEILSRFTNDMDNISTTLQEGLGSLLSSVLTVFGVLGMMLWLSPLLAVVFVVTIPMVATGTIVIARKSKRQFGVAWKTVGRLNGMVEETHTGHSLVMAFGQRERKIKEFDRQNDQLRDATARAQFLSGTVQPTVQFVGNLNYVVIAALGGYQVASGLITLGVVQAFIQYSRRFSMPAAQIAGQMNLIQSGLASAERVFRFLDSPEERQIAGRGASPAVGAAVGPAVGAVGPAVGAADATGGAAREDLASAQGTQVGRRVQLQHVSFRYKPDTPLIDDFTLEAAPGQTVAIVGPTGAGKTTVVNLLMRFYEIQAGRILLDGVDYASLGRDEVRRCFGMVLQDTWLFRGTIRENIAYGRAGATDEEIIAAAKAAHVDNFVRALPDGYDTVVTGDATSISAGQKQLLTIARAFLADPGILILDEATSNVDTRTELLIQDAMTRLRAGRTSFVIAHRLSTIRNADTIVVMDGGRIAEQGTHDELLLRGGLYHHLHQSQFSAALVS